MAGFLGLNNKAGVKPTGVKPVAPAIKPGAIKPIAKPVVGAVKPTVTPITKPAVKPIAKSVELKEEVKTEEEVTIAPTLVATEAIDSAQEDMVAESNLGRNEAEIQTESMDVTHSPETEEEKQAVNEYIESQKTKDVEAKEKKTTTKKAARTTKKVAEEKVEEYVPEAMPKRSEVNYEEVIASTIIYSAGAEWDMQVAELTSQLKSIVIEPDMNSATMKQAMSDLVGLKDTIFGEYTLNKTILEATNRKIDMVKGLNAKGSSADERKLNSLKAVVEHKEGGLTINLYELLDVITAKFNFYDGLMKQIEFKAKSLITMNGALKLEKDALGSQI